MRPTLTPELTYRRAMNLALRLNGKLDAVMRRPFSPDAVKRRDVIGKRINKVLNVAVQTRGLA